MTKKVLPIVMLLAFPTLAAAHPTWFSGTASAEHDYANIVLQLTTSHHFPALESAVPPARLQRVSVVTKDTVAPLLVQSSEPDHLQLRSKVAAQNSVWAVAETKASAIELDPATVAIYLTELGQPGAVARQYKKTGQWREHYSKHAKSWVQLSGAAADKFMLEPLQLAYELVPSTDLSQLKVNQRFTLCAYAQGKAVPGAFITISDHKGGHAQRHADAQGCARFKRPEGQFLAHSILIKPNADADWDWRSHFATLTYISAQASHTQRASSTAIPSTPQPKVRP